MQTMTRSHELVTHFSLFGHSIRLPMELGAPRRLELAQFLYQFPLGVFAISLATAIFPGLSADALDKNRDQFKNVLRQGILATIWEGLPASLGLILVAEPAARMLFQHGHLSGHDALLIAHSTVWYAGAIWAFSLLQILNRAYYAIHDTVTPLMLAVINILLNLVVEIPLLWIMGESAMAVGTLVSFIIQAIVMLYMLDRRIGGLGLASLIKPVAKMLLATAIMGLACWGVQHLPGYPAGTGRLHWLGQLVVLIGVGAAVYFGACYLLGVEMMKELIKGKSEFRNPKPERKS
jgi:putative peptidoglycan lipid II flippase